MRELYYLLRLALVPAFALVGAAAGYYAEATVLSSGLLLAEPVYWVGMVWIGWALFRARRYATLMGMGLGMMTAVVAIHIPAAPAEPEGIDPAPFVREVRACTRGLALPAEHVRLLQWTVTGDTAELAHTVTDAHPDVAVIYGPLSESMREAVAAGVGGEALSIPGQDAPIHVFAAQVFNKCGNNDQWRDRPANGADVALVFVAASPTTAFPLLITRLPDPGATPDWGEATAGARSALRATIDGMESSLLVTTVSAMAPLAAPRLTRTLLATGLIPVARPLNWPTWSPLRLHAFDQVWAAKGWIGGTPEALSGGGSRDGVLVELAPRWPVALPAPGDDDPVR